MNEIRDIDVYVCLFCFYASNKMLNKHSNIKSDAQTSAHPSSKATGKVSLFITISGAATACFVCSSQTEQHTHRAKPELPSFLGSS